MLSHHERVVHEAPLWDGSERGQCWSMADHVGGRKPTGGAIAAGEGEVLVTTRIERPGDGEAPARSQCLHPAPASRSPHNIQAPRAGPESDSASVGLLGQPRRAGAAPERRSGGHLRGADGRQHHRPGGRGRRERHGRRVGSGGIEYALIALNVRHIVVMGHSSCGAMAKVLSAHPLEGAPNLERWLVHARKASDRLTAAAFIDRALSPGDQLSQANVLQQLEHVRSYALVAGQVAQGDLELHGAWFDIERADLHIWSAKKSRFIRMDEAVIARVLAAGTPLTG